jgi:hypothetical protein
MTFRLSFPARSIPVGGGTVGLAEYLLERLTERLQLGAFLSDAGADEPALQLSLRTAAAKLRGVVGAAQEGSFVLLTDAELRALRLVAVPPTLPPTGAYWALATTLRPLFNSKAQK